MKMNRAKAPIGLTIMEKIIGLLMIVIGTLTAYVTYTDLGRLGLNLMLFLAAGIALILIGFFLVTVKVE